MTPAPARKNLPEGWRWVRLGGIADRIDYGFTASADFSVSEPRFLRITDIARSGVDWDTVPGCKINPAEEASNGLMDGDIVVARSGATTGKSFLVRCPPRAVFASYLIRVRLGDDAMASYVYFFFNSDAYWQQMRTTRRGGAQPNVNATLLGQIEMPLPPLPEQKRISAMLTEQLAAVEGARAAAEAQLQAAKALPAAYVRQSLAGSRNLMALSDCLIEVSRGIGSTWSQYRVLGATRAGLALAKERVGKHPERYKLVDAGTIFYNPMRILLGSIAMVDEGDETGITSPDYVVLKTKQGVLHPRWFYYWLRSPEGDCFIKTLTRGAVRERMLFRRLAEASIELPPWSAQTEAAAKLTPVRTAAETMAQQLAAINALPAALLRPAFSGEL
jgi:type I restriction enzyme S subunit